MYVNLFSELIYAHEGAMPLVTSAYYYSFYSGKRMLKISALFFNRNIKMKYDRFFENSRAYPKWLT